MNVLKRWIAIAICLIIGVSLYGVAKHQEGRNERQPAEAETVKYIESNPREYQLDEIIVGIHEDLSLTQEMAFEIGKVVLNSAFGEGEAESYIVNRVGEYYIITRIPNHGVPGYSYNVALQREDGTILKVWMDE